MAYPYPTEIELGDAFQSDSELSHLEASGEDSDLVGLHDRQTAQCRISTDLETSDIRDFAYPETNFSAQGYPKRSAPGQLPRSESEAYAAGLRSYGSLVFAFEDCHDARRTVHAYLAQRLTDTPAGAGDPSEPAGLRFFKTSKFSDTDLDGMDLEFGADKARNRVRARWAATWRRKTPKISDAELATKTRELEDQLPSRVASWDWVEVGTVRWMGGMPVDISKPRPKNTTPEATEASQQAWSATAHLHAMHCHSAASLSGEQPVVPLQAKLLLHDQDGSRWEGSYSTDGSVFWYDRVTGRLVPRSNH